jgi:hypothetical protein
MTKRWLKHPWYAFSSGVICRDCNRITLIGHDVNSGCVRNQEDRRVPKAKIKGTWRIPI